MPVVKVDWWEGRSDELKEKVIVGITKVLEDVGIPASHTTVVIQDYPKANWGVQGTQASKLK